jgi:hypothetical protein
MNHILIHLFLTLNFALFFSYVFAKLFFSIEKIKAKLTQFQQLKLARFIFLISVLVFCIMPYVTSLIPTEPYHLEQNHTFDKTSMLFVHSKKMVLEKMASSSIAPTIPPLKSVLFSIWCIGFIMIFIQYLRNIRQLKKIRIDSRIYRTQNKIRILLSPKKITPFCWSFFNNHFIVVNEKNSRPCSDWNMIIRHELAHIRHRDTNWLHLFAILKCFFFINPFHYFWVKWFHELQEYACDETVIMKNKTKNTAYAQCLINSARYNLSHLSWSGAPSMSHLHQTILFRRINMIFSYNKKSYRFFFIFALLQFMMISSVAFALNQLSSADAITSISLKNLISNASIDPTMKITAQPEVILEINHIQKSHAARKKIKESLARMSQYQLIIEPELKNNSIPNDFLAMPLIQSGYRELDENQNRVHAAGIWQIVPSTAMRLGLVVTQKDDQRMNAEQATKAATHYLSNLYNEFHDWKLVVLAYEYGEKTIGDLIKQTGTTDAWKLVRSNYAPKEMSSYLAKFDSAVIIIRNPALIAGNR